MNSNNTSPIRNTKQQLNQQQQQQKTPPSSSNNQLNSINYLDSPGTDLANKLASLTLNSGIKNRILSFDERSSKEIELECKIESDLNFNESGGNHDGIYQDELLNKGRDNDKDELTLLSISSQITELNLIIEETNTIIFEIQELRHTTAPSNFTSPNSQSDVLSPSLKPADVSSTLTSPSELSLPPPVSSDQTSSNSNGALSEVDVALMKLDEKLEAVAKEYASVESQISPIFASISKFSDDSRNHAEFLQEKWLETVSTWQSTRDDADILSDELKEDKWLVVFRVVSNQAEEMMSSLEKVLTQSHSFIWDINRRQAQIHSSAASPHLSPFQLPVDLPGSTSFSPQSSPFSLPSDLPSTSSSSQVPSLSDSHSAQALLTTFLELNKSLTAKVKYYSPAVERVLKILGKGISERSTKNGEVLRKFGEMKNRWRDGTVRIERVKEEMKVLEIMLRETASKQQSTVVAPSIVSPPSAYSTPTHSTSSILKPSTASPSPFRRLASKISTRSSPPVSTPIASTSLLTRPSPSPSSTNLRSLTSPPRPIKSTKRIDSSPDTISTHLPPSSSRPNNLNRISQSYSTSNLLYPPLAPSSGSRSRSPAPSDGGYSNNGGGGGGGSSGNKPRWNISSKRPEEKEILLDSQRSTGRTSLGGTSYFQPMRDSPSSNDLSGIRNGRHSSLGINSRNRAPSPAFSSFSNDSMGGGFISSSRDRPQTPTSIPRPRGSSISSSSHQYNQNNLGKSLPASFSSNHLSTPPIAATPHTPRSRVTSGSGIPQPSQQRPISPAYSTTSISSQNLRTPYSRPSNTNVEHQLRPPLSSGGSGSSSYNNFKRRSSYTPSYNTANQSRPTSVIGYNSYYQVEATIYKPNSIDLLDLELAKIMNSLPVYFFVQRVDPPLSSKDVNSPSSLSARYYLSTNGGGANGGRGLIAMNCKLVQREGKKKKVLVRVGGGFVELESWALAQLGDNL